MRLKKPLPQLTRSTAIETTPGHALVLEAPHSKPMEPARLIHASLWLLAVAATIGIVMAVIRFAKEKAPPVILSKAHGFLNCSAMALLVYGWATVGLPKLASIALVLLLVAASGGLAMGQAWRWKHSHRLELVLFAHLSIAAAGFFLLLAAPVTS